MSTNPARTFGPALFGSYWHALWIYFIGPPLGMLAAAEVFLLAREGNGPYCAKLYHHNDKRCIFRHSGPDPTTPVQPNEYHQLLRSKSGGFTPPTPDMKRP